MDIESTAPADGAARTVCNLQVYEYDLKVMPEVISSCSEQKQSYPLLHQCFQNVPCGHMGAQMLSVYANADCRQQRKSRAYLGDVRAVHEPECIDTVVYTRNRAFRMCGSSKLGSLAC